MVYENPTVNIMLQQDGSYRIVKFNDGAALLSSQIIAEKERLRKYIEEHKQRGFEILSEPSETYRAVPAEELADLIGQKNRHSLFEEPCKLFWQKEDTHFQQFLIPWQVQGL